MSESAAERLPLFPLGIVLFPGMLLPLHIFEERYRRLLRDRRDADPIFGVVLTRQGREVGDRPEIHEVGTAATLLGAGRYPDGRADLVVRGARRFRVGPGNWDNEYLVAEVAWLDPAPPEPAPAPNLPALAAQVADVYEAFLAAVEQTTGATLPREATESDPDAAAYAVCARLPIEPRERQLLLEEPTTGSRLTRLLTILRRERDLLRETGAGGAVIEQPGRRFSAN